MSDPARSKALARALAEEDDGLCEDFAARVAVLAEARGAKRAIWSGVAMLLAFGAMIGLCFAGWRVFAAPLALGVRDLALPPWLVIAVAGAVLVQLLAFGRRATT